MKPIRFDGMNKIYTAPEGWDEATMGVCRDLPVLEELGAITSCYELSHYDIVKIMDSAKLYFTIFTPRQPVVSWDIR